jgi:uncharacterized membrane protein YbhN (UPF0104 family)
VKAKPQQAILSSQSGGIDSSALRTNYTNENTGKKKTSAWLKKGAAIFIILVCSFFLGKTLYNNLGQLGAYQWQLKPILLILSFVFLEANLAVSVLVWKRILNLFGVNLPFGKSFKITFVSAPGKYVPGKVWIYLSQIYLSQKAGIPKSIALFSMLLLFGGYVLAGVVIFIFSLFFWQGISWWLISAFLLLSLTALGLLFTPRMLNLILKVAGFFSSKFKESRTPEKLTITGGISEIFFIISILLADWLIFGVAVYFLINSFYQIDLQQTVVLCGIFAVSVLAGIASFFVPAGLGVREGVQSYLLGLFIPVSAAVLISLVMRVWMSVGETGCFFAALKIKEPKLW